MTRYLDMDFRFRGNDRTAKTGCMITLANQNIPVETPENRRKRLIFRSWHRGTREMDLIMGTFADAHVPAMDTPALNQFERLLDTPDPDVYDWYIGKTPVPDGELTDVVKLFLQHKFVK